MLNEINFLNIAQVLIGIALIGFILIQRGPGATAGSAFGGGASGTVFGAKGSGSFLTKTTALLAAAFFIVTLLMAIESNTATGPVDTGGEKDLGVMGTLQEDEQSDVPMVSGATDDASEVPVIDQVTQPVDDVIMEDKNDDTEVDDSVPTDESVTDADDSGGNG